MKFTGYAYIPLLIIVLYNNYKESSLFQSKLFTNAVYNSPVINLESTQINLSENNYRCSTNL